MTVSNLVFLHSKEELPDTETLFVRRREREGKRGRNGERGEGRERGERGKDGGG